MTRQLPALPSTAEEWKGMGAVWGNADDFRLPVAAGERLLSWDVPGVGNYVGNPGGVYGIVPGDMDHAIASQLTTDVKPAVSSSKDVGGIRVDGSRVPEVDTARAVVGGETYGGDLPKVNPSGQTPKVSVGGGESGTPSVDIKLKYKDGWIAAQKAEADAKVKALSNATTVKTPANRGGTSASSRYKSAYGNASVPSGYDVDHTIDLQLGGADDILNMNPLDMSVNRSLGVQIKNATKDYPDGTVFGQFTIK